MLIEEPSGTVPFVKATPPAGCCLGSSPRGTCQAAAVPIILV